MVAGVADPGLAAASTDTGVSDPGYKNQLLSWKSLLRSNQQSLARPSIREMNPSGSVPGASAAGSFAALRITRRFWSCQGRANPRFR